MARRNADFTQGDAMKHILKETAETIGFLAIVLALLFFWIATP